jgi:ribosomal protein S27E
MEQKKDPFTGLDLLPPFVYERTEGAASLPLANRYRPIRHPENAPLYRIVYHALDEFLEESRETGNGYPSFIEKEFRNFLGCRVISRGFARVRCPECKDEQLLPFTCSTRICPSCSARRAADTAATLVDQVLPEAPYRQFVMTYPFDMRFALAFNPNFFTKTIRVFMRALFAWYRKRGRRLGIQDGKPGAVALLQLFGGAINLHPHLHVTAADGCFVSLEGEKTLHFHPLPAPTEKELQDLLVRVIQNTLKLYQKTYGEQDEELDPDDLPIAQAMSEALRVPQQSSQSQPDHEDHQPVSLCLKMDGFSLHAARKIEPQDRAGLEKLLRYGTRSPIASRRLRIDQDGQVVYQLAKPWGASGITCLRLSPVTFLRRLAMLIPHPFQNMVRYYGVFSGSSKLRPRLPLPKELEAKIKASKENDQEPITSEDLPPRTYRVPWAQLMRRVIGVDPLICKCGAALTVIAFLSDPKVVLKILEHLKIPTSVHPEPLPTRLTQRELEAYSQEPWLTSSSYPHQEIYEKRPRPPPDY